MKNFTEQNEKYNACICKLVQIQYNYNLQIVLGDPCYHVRLSFLWDPEFHGHQQDPGVQAYQEHPMKQKHFIGERE